MDVIQNIKKIRIAKNINQDVIAMALGFDVSNWNKIENGKQQLKVNQLEKIAQVLGVKVIDLFTYPDVYVNPSTLHNGERISVTFDIPIDNKPALLKMINAKSVEE